GGLAAFCRNTDKHRPIALGIAGKHIRLAVGVRFGNQRQSAALEEDPAASRGDLWVGRKGAVSTDDRVGGSVTIQIRTDENCRTSGDIPQKNVAAGIRVVGHKVTGGGGKCCNAPIRRTGRARYVIIRSSPAVRSCVNQTAFV